MKLNFADYNPDDPGAFLDAVAGDDAHAAQDDFDSHREPPKPDPLMFYGFVGEVARAASSCSEVNPVAAGAAMLAALGVAVGRDIFLPIGDTRHHLILNTLHVGRTARGRKGDSTKLVRRIMTTTNELHERATGGVDDSLCGQCFTGGLSTREGLAMLIHDGYTLGKEDVAPIRDKRLLVIESEFANVLHQGQRNGNTLSAALRDCWDGQSLTPAIKGSKIWATDPHIGLIANITPGELNAMLEAKEISNGFANRFFVYWAERTRLVPNPVTTHPEVVNKLALRLREIVLFARGDYPNTQDSCKLRLTPEAQALYNDLYRTELNQELGERVTALLERRAPMLLRLASIFALTDKQLEIEAKHIQAALAWSDYHRDSVQFIFASERENLEQRETAAASAKIVEFLRTAGRASRTEISTQCFHRNLASVILDRAIQQLLIDTPPRLVLEVKKSAHAGPRTKFYSLTPYELNELTNNVDSKGENACFQSYELNELNELINEEAQPATSTGKSYELNELNELINEEAQPATSTGISSFNSYSFVTDEKTKKPIKSTLFVNSFNSYRASEKTAGADYIEVEI